MTTQEVAAIVAQVGIPYAYYQFTKDTAVAPPFICFFYPYDNDVKADNSNYQAINHLVIELYTDQKDFALEKTVENVLRSHEMVWSKEEEYLDSERMHEVVYEMDVVITED